MSYGPTEQCNCPAKSLSKGDWQTKTNLQILCVCRTLESRPETHRDESRTSLPLLRNVLIWSFGSSGTPTHTHTPRCDLSANGVIRAPAVTFTTGACPWTDSCCCCYLATKNERSQNSSRRKVNQELIFVLGAAATWWLVGLWACGLVKAPPSRASFIICTHSLAGQCHRLIDWITRKRNSNRKRSRNRIRNTQTKGSGRSLAVKP